MYSTNICMQPICMQQTNISSNIFIQCTFNQVAVSCTKTIELWWQCNNGWMRSKTNWFDWGYQSLSPSFIFPWIFSSVYCLNWYQQIPFQSYHRFNNEWVMHNSLRIVVLFHNINTFLIYVYYLLFAKYRSSIMYWRVIIDATKYWIFKLFHFQTKCINWW